ncbi:MAG TPA: tetratricopeptide repeat protein [Acidobacteriaceae bacterium]
MTIRRSLLLTSALLLTTAMPAFAVNKDMVQLQTQVQTLQDAVARLQQSNDERMGVLKDLVQQTADAVNKMSVSTDSLQKSMSAQQEAQNGKIDQISGQIQSLNDSIDELKAQMGRLTKAMQDIQSQQQSINASMSSIPASGASATGVGAAPADSTTPPPANPIPDIMPQATTPKGRRSAQPAATNAPPVEQLYQTAYGDYNSGKNALASTEFADVVKYYPDNNLAGNAHFYMGEILMKQNKPGPAAKEYDKVLEQYPGNSKIPASQLHKANALIAIRQTDAGIRELRSLIQRYPNSPEAVAARAKLNSLGARSR